MNPVKNRYHDESNFLVAGQLDSLRQNRVLLNRLMNYGDYLEGWDAHGCIIIIDNEKSSTPNLPKIPPLRSQTPRSSFHVSTSSGRRGDELEVGGLSSLSCCLTVYLNFVWSCSLPRCFLSRTFALSEIEHTVDRSYR